MKCPFCGNEMKKGKLKGDSRTMPKWENDGEKRSLFGSGRVVRNFKRLGTAFEADGFLCERCGKAVLDIRL